MRFAYTPPGGERAEFEGPPRGAGAIVGFTRGELGWLKQQLNIASVMELDPFDAMLFYYVLSIRRHDHRLLPPAVWDDIAVSHFRDLRHPFEAQDDDGNCAQCQQLATNGLHKEPVMDPIEPVSILTD